MNYKELIPGSKYFIWNEALYLPSWNTHHIPSDAEKENIIKMVATMDKIREYLDCPIITHIWLRPVLNNPDSDKSGQDYNVLVGGAAHSAHKVGLAVDFHPANMTCSEAKAKLIIKLADFNIRMENNGDDANWVHVDLFPANPNRYFKP